MNHSRHHPLLPCLPRPSHYLGTEYNAVHKDPARIALHWGLAFPDLYQVGMSHLGLKVLYHILNADPRIWAERAFAPSPEAAAILRDSTSPLATLESHTPLSELDILGFSLTHELCYTTVLYMLDLAHIPFRSSERSAGHPLLIAGGGACVNPEPVAPFFDLFVIGDGEEVVSDISRIVLQAKEDQKSKPEILAQLGDLPGIYVPAPFHRTDMEPPRVEKRVLVDLNAAQPPAAQIVPYGQAVHDRLTLEIARGCTRGCRFCQAGMTMRPVRERSLPRLDEQLQAGLDGTGFEEISFLSLSTGDYSQLEALFNQSLARCQKEQVAISLPSLRVGSLSPRLMRSMASLRRTGATVAPEAGSQRLRDVINKGITEQALLEHAGDLFASGWKRIKLYFMIGLPTETYQDLQAIHDLCLRVLDTAGTEKKKVQLTASVAVFVPKPHTPFQWEAQDDPATVREKIAFLQDLFRRPKNLTLRWHDPEMSSIEGVFSRGDRSLAPVLEDAYARGDILSSWQEHFDFSLWNQVLTEHGTDLAPWLGARSEEEALPWRIINCGVRRDFLLRERKKAWEEATTKDCRYHGCTLCGVCSGREDPGELAVQAAEQPIRPVVNQKRRDQGEGQDDVLARTGGMSEEEHNGVSLVLTYSKLGPAAHLSQLELQTVCERLFRRARLPLSFSRGFHPMPRISFGRALPVGVHSEAEACVVGLRRSVSDMDLCARLNAVSVPGVEFLRAEEQAPGHKLKQPRYERFLLRYNLPQSKADYHIESWMELTRAESWIVSRKTKKGSRDVDLRSRLSAVQPLSPSGVEITFDWEPGYISPLFVVQALNPALDPGTYTLTKKKPFHPSGQ
ncbi:TIGR03960 family B12-binding radical SAM protein [Desulfovermiculus halophilus]|uniref:TIGR03960 family B12-binding radical SAM protein n=1 Tax=Desulfovermiculus halophilus TaxID=339722 RepID=UPI0004871F47|nr:TIGR03960 family B12-binding radical SAM protein [Desulfovermiculus halophilus]